VELEKDGKDQLVGPLTQKLEKYYTESRRKGKPYMQ
jgi:hypothetical protein